MRRKAIKGDFFSSSARSCGVDLLGGFGSLVVSVKSEVHLFSRRLEVVVGLVLGLGLSVKNNTGNLSVSVVTLERDGDGSISYALDSWGSGPVNCGLSC